MKTRTELQQYFECTDAQLDALVELQETGKAHGAAGRYPDGDFSSDADWCYGVGAAISDLEEALGDECGDVFDVYSDAHTENFVLQAESCEYTIEVFPCDISVRGNALASGDKAADREAEAAILDQLANGNHWAWCNVTVTCEFNDEKGTAHLGAVSIDGNNEAAFKRSSHYADLCAEAFADLQRVRNGE